MRYCENFAALLDAYVDGELSGEEAARVRDHLETCAGCRRYVDDALAIRAAFPEVEETEVPEGFADGVMAVVREAENRRSGAQRRVLYWRKILLPLAACFAVVLILRAVPGGGSGSAPAGDNAAPKVAMDAAASYGLAEETAPCEIEAYGGDTLSAAPYDLATEPAVENDADVPAKEADGETPAARIAAVSPTSKTDSGGAPTGEAADLAAAQATPTGEEGDPAALQMAPTSNGEGTNSAPASPETEAGAGTEAVEPRTVEGEATRQSRAVRLTAEEAGELLAELPYTEEEDGSRCYQLPSGDFDALLAALAERGITPPETEVLGEEVLPEDCDLVYVTEE